MKRIMMMFVLLGLFVISCSGKNMEMPEEMPTDFNFSIQFGVGSKNAINMFENQIVKDLIVDGIATAPFRFSEDEMIKIYRKMREINIMEEKKLKPWKKNCSQIPYEEDKWTIQMNGKTIIHEWSGEHCEKTKDAEQLLELRNFVFGIVKNKDEYKQLPEATGGYE